MNIVFIAIIFVGGFIVGFIVAFMLLREKKAQVKEHINAFLDQVKASLGSIQHEALSKASENFLHMAKERLGTEREVNAKELEAKKGLIDQQLGRMTIELDKVTAVVKDLEKDRESKFGELANQLKTTSEQTAALMNTTNMLREVLGSTKARGQWGERMAEDVLRLAGFIENVNYLKQKAIGDDKGRPDFTFILPRDLKLNMDVKFPLDNYARYVEAKTEMEKEKFCSNFLRDVKARIREVTTREYINPKQNTLDYVILFIPNEQIYTFIHERNSSLIDEGIKNKVVCCSPITLFAVLAVIRQAIDNFALEKASNEMLSLYGAFNKQWGEFCKKMEDLGKRIGDTQKEYNALSTTRQQKLEVPLKKIEVLRTQRGLPVNDEQEENLLINEPQKE
ncbi:MAG: DNA recombination protein RmuC [Candidatus Omnitrophica bacterium]|nr:DNA recombination protein RmuC [Candidatus Omnitrophota bacterium]